MPRGSLTGSRIRERRLMMGRKQADLAQSVGISPSYLNLIEHNRRRIGGKLLNAIAASLDVEPVVLAEGAEGALLEELRAAALDQSAVEDELPRLDEFVGRFPGWAGLLAESQRRISGLERAVSTLSDRLTHDPFLSASLHEVLSSVTAIRSSASILAETPDIDPEWRGRFHRNIHEDSQRLAESAAALVRYLDQETSTDVKSSTPQEEMDSFLAAQGFHIAELERALPRSAEALVAEAEQLTSSAGRVLTEAHLTRYRKDAEHMPLADMLNALQAGPFDPAHLAQKFGVDLMAVFRRLACLPPSSVLGEVGLVICDGSGTLTFRKPVDGFPLPRFGAACPLWPLYQALSRPMSPLRAMIEMGGRSPRQFLTYATCQPSQPGGFGGPQVLEAAMLILPPDVASTEGIGPDVELGTSCRICSRMSCPARREPSIMESPVL